MAFGPHLIEFDGVVSSHNTWFLIVALSAMMAYDLQRLKAFNINVLGAQLSMKERLLANPPAGAEFDIGRTTPTAHRSHESSGADLYQRLDDEPDAVNVVPPSLGMKGSKTSLESVDLQPDIGGPALLDHKDSSDSRGSGHSEKSMSYLVFKQFSFRMEDKKQQLLVYNAFLLMYSIGNFVSLFNFWVNIGQSSFDSLKQRHPLDFTMHLTDRSYALFCSVCCLNLNMLIMNEIRFPVNFTL